jgi:hypothetical protein
MKKAGLTTYVAIGVGVLAIGAIAAVSRGGSDAEVEKKAAAIQAQANKKETPQMTAKEQQEHLKTTALAFERAQLAAQEKKAEAARAQAAAEAARAQVEASNVQAAPAPAAAGPAPAPKKAVNKKAEKKELDSLDSIGSDIASALE